MFELTIYCRDSQRYLRQSELKQYERVCTGFALTVISPTDIWGVGENGRTVHSTGGAFTAASVGSLRDLRGIWAAPGGYPLWVGGYSVIWRKASVAAAWTLGRAAALRTTVEQALMSAVPGLRATIQLLPSDVEAHYDDEQDLI